MEMPAEQVAHPRTGTTRNPSRIVLTHVGLHHFGHSFLLHHERRLNLHLLRFHRIRLFMGDSSMASRLHLAGNIRSPSSGKSYNFLIF